MNESGARTLSVAHRSADVAAVRAFHATLPGYVVTPLHESAELADFLGVRTVLVKDERARLGLPSFKILGASWAAARSLAARGAGHDGSLEGIRAVVEAAAESLVLVAATDGNHGRAVARVARLFGAQALIFMPSAISPPRADAILGEGAQVLRIRGSYDDAVDAAASLAASAGNVLLISDTTRGDAVEPAEWVIEGYGTIFDELDQQLGQGHVARNGRTLVAIQAGVGTLAAAAARYLDARWPREQRRLVTVEPSSSACVQAAIRARHPIRLPGAHTSAMTTLNAGTVSSAAWHDLAASVDAAIAIEDDALVEVLRELHAAGMDTGESGAAGLAGARAYIETLHERDRPDHVIVMLTEGVNDGELHERLLARGSPAR